MAEQSGYIVPVNFVAEGQAAVNAALTGTATKIRQISTEAKQAEKDATKALNEIATAAGKATGEIKKLDEKLTSVGKKSPAGTAAGVSASAPIAPGSDATIAKWIADFDKIKTQLIGIAQLFRQVESVAQSLAAIQIAPEIASELATGKAYLAIATAAQKAAAELQAYDAVARKQIATDKELLDVKTRLSSLQGKQAARQDPGYQREVAELQKLTRAEMEKVAVDKLIDKLYQDRARIIAYSSDAYKQEAAGLAKLTMEERVAAETAKQLEIQQQRVAKAMALTDPAVRALVKEYEKLTKQQQHAAVLTSGLSDRISGANQIAAGFRAALSGIGMGFGIYTSATIVAASATYAVVAAFRDWVSTGAEFEKEMARVNAAMNLTSEQYDDLSRRAVAMAETSRFTTGEIVKAYREMAMSGFSYQETVDGIQSVMAMASIGMMEFGEAADIATNVLFGFNLEAKDLSSVVDVLATTITNSAQDLQQLGNTMSYVAPVAASYGISLQMVAAATEVLANAGIKGSRSGTGLRRTLTALFSDSEKADTALGNLGVHVNTLAQDMDQELLRVLRELNKATNGATTNVGELNTAVGIYAIPTFLNLVKAADESVTSLDALAKKYDDVSGAAFGMQKRMEAALSVDWEKALAAWSAIKTELFLLFGGDLREFVQDLTAWIRGLADSKDVILETIDLLKELLKTVTLVTGAILALSAAKGAGNLLGSGIGAGKNLLGALGQKAPALAATTLAAGGAAEVAAIKATTELTKDAVKQTGAWAASKKLLGVAMRAVPYAGTLLILKDIYDIYANLTKITPKQAEEVTKLADAQQVLNERLRGFKLLSTTEASAAAAASAQKSYDDTRVSLRALGEEILAVESQLDAVLYSATPGSQTDRLKIKVLMEDLDALRKKYNDMVATSKDSNAKLNNATRSLMESSRVALEREALALERLRDTAKKELEAAQQRMKEPVYAGGRTSAEEDLAKYKQMFEDLGSIGQYLRGFDTFAEYLEEVAPGLARVSAGLVKAEEDLEAASKKSDRFSNSLKEQRYRLGQAAEGVEAYDASLDAVRQAAEYSNKIEGFFKDTAKAIEDVAEANRLENMTMEEKKQHFQGLITKYDDLFASTKELAAETSNLTIQMVLLENAKKIALADNSWTGGQEATLLAVQERLATLSKNMQTLSEQKGARLEWGKELNGLKDDAAATTESTNDLRQSILELFNMDDADFPDTLSGNFEKLLKQSEALRTNIEKIRSGEIAVGKSSGGMYGGSGTVNVSGGGSAAEIMSKYGGIIRQASEKFALDIKLLIAVIQQESGGNPNAVSPAGARGLMQLMPGTAAGLGVTNAFDPFQNIMAGAKYLRQQVSKFGDLEWALAAYNAGPGAAESRDPDLSKYKAETQNYVPSVLARIGKIGDIGDAAAEVDKVTTAVKGADEASKSAGQSIQGVDTAAQAATQSAKVWSEGLQLSAEEMGAAVEKMQADWDAASQRQLGPADADRYEKEMKKLMAARKQNQIDLEAALQQMNSGPITEQEIAKFETLTEEGKKLSQVYVSMRDQAVPMYEDLIKQGYDYGDSLKYNKAQLEALAEGYDSVYTRARQYNLVMVQIQKLEEGGYLTKSEAALAKIDARFENLDPLTKDVATNIMNTLKNVATGASTGKEAMDSLKESLVDIAMEKYVVKIGLDIVGQIMDPFLVAFQNIAMGMLSGLGDILASGISSLFSGGSGTGTGGTSGTGIMDTISKVFNGNSIGKGIADALMKSGFGRQIGESAGYEITSSMSGWTSGIANTPNWAYGAGSILGSLAGNAIFKGKGYSGIGSSIGAMAGSIGGAAFGGSAAGTAALAALGISTGGVGLIVAAIVGGLLGGVAGGGLGSLFGNAEPRPGAYAAITHGGTGMLEDSVGAKGAFGLTFGMSDIGTKGLDAAEMQETFDGFAKVSEVLAEFYGKDVSAMVEESLKATSMGFYSKNGILRYAMDVNEAFDVAFTQIVDAAAATGDDMAILLKATIGDLSGTVESMATQIEAGMATAKAAMELAKAFAGQDIADKLQLSDKLVDSALGIIHYANTIKTATETSAEAMARLAINLAGLESALEITGTETAAVGQAFVDLSSQLEESAKAAKITMADLITLQAYYFENFYSASEKAVKALTQTMDTLKEEFPKLKEKLLGINAPDKIKIEVPELKKIFTPDPNANADAVAQGAGGFFGWLRGFYETVDQMDWDLPANSELRDEIMTQFRGMGSTLKDVLMNVDWTLPENSEMLDKILKAGGAEDVRDLIEALKSIGLASDLRNPDSWQDPDGAKAALRAAEMYAFGVSQGTISKNADTEAKLLASLQSYSEELKALGYDLSAGLFGVVDQIKNWAKTSFMSDSDRQSLTKDPNVDVYSRLVNDMPKTREDFDALIKQINQETDADRLLYIELMKLVPAFDAMYDAIESFESWLGVSTEVEQAKKRLTKIFEDAGMKLPGSKDELKELYESGKLTAEFMAILGASAEDLKLVFDELANNLSLLDFAEILDPTHQASKDAIAKAEAELRKYGYTGDIHDSEGLAEFFRMIKATDTEASNAAEDLEKFFNANREVFDALAAAAEERAGLEMRLLELTGTKTQILAEKRRLEIEATDESNRALLRYIHTLEDAAAAAAEMASLTERLYAAAGDDAMVTQLQRQAELAEALSDGARAMLLMIYAIEDSAAAAEAANKQAEEAAQAANDAARAAFDANQEATRKQADAVQELVSTLQSLRDALKSAIEAIFIETPLTRVSTRDEAQEQITAALVAARGGVMPDLEQLSPYLDVVSQNAESQFASLEEYQRDAYRTRAELVELEALLGDQQTIEEQTLEALNTIINESFPESDANADQNADKIVVDVQRLIAIANAINEGVLRMDTDLDGVITFDEMRTALAGLATDPELRALFDMLDVNGDGILSALEAMPLKIAQNLTGMFDLLDTDLDGLLTFSELQIGLGPLATDEQIQAMMTMMDVNHDGLISEVEALRYQIISDSNILFAKIDTNGDKALTHDEFMAGVAGMASDVVLQGFWNSLDLNHDQLLTATEAIPLQIATNLSSYFNTLDTNTDKLLTFDELKAGLGGMATDYQIQQLIWAVDANGDGMISEQEAATFKLGTLNTKADYQAQQLIALSYIATDIQKVDDNTANINYWQVVALGKFDAMIGATTTGNTYLNAINNYLNSINNAVWQIKDQLVTSNTHLADIRVSDYNSRFNLKRIVDFGTAIGGGYATGGVAEGPLTGYPATLHGREAVIPLGDGNKVVATLRDPINASSQTSFDEGLRASLDELRAELIALRRDQQAIGATTVGELKDHNRRERRRDVVPQQVEVIS